MHHIQAVIFLVNGINVKATALPKHTTLQVYNRSFPFYFDARHYHRRYFVTQAILDKLLYLTGHHKNQEKQHAYVASKSTPTLLTATTSL